MVTGATYQSTMPKATWAMKERKFGNWTLDEAEVARLALIKAEEQQWSCIMALQEDRNLVKLLQEQECSSCRAATILADIKSLGLLFS